MSITDFIKNRLISFLDRFKMAKVRFGIDRIANVHTVEVYPSGLLEDDAVFDYVDSLISDSIRLYPDDLLCVRKEDIMLGVGELLFEKEGIEYNPISISSFPSTPQTNGIGVQWCGFTIINSDQEHQGITQSDESLFIENEQLDEYPLAA